MFLVSITCVSFSFTSCKDETDEPDLPSNNSNIMNILTSYKWRTQVFNLDIADDLDYLYYEGGYIYLYFMNDGTGIARSTLNQVDSDGYSDNDDKLTKFSFYINSENKVILSIGTLKSYLNLESETELVAYSGNLYKGQTFNRLKIEDNDYKYIPSTGKCGNNLNYKYDPITHELSIYGEGSMYDYTNSTPWSEFYVEKVKIESGVTTIGDYAFTLNNILHDVELPNSLTSIGAYSFYQTLISKITIPKNISVIGEAAFGNCAYLKNVTIPQENNITIIEDDVFFNCTKLTFGSINLPNIIEVGNGVFSTCSVGDITFGDNLKKIGNYAFSSGVKNKELILPNSLESIGVLAFSGSFSKIEIGQNVNFIGNNAFITSGSGSFYVDSQIPLTLTDNILINNQNKSITNLWTLYVPVGSKEAYKKTFPWNQFKDIIEASSNGEENGNTGNEGTTNPDEYSDKAQDEIFANSPNRGPVSSWFSGGSGTKSDPYLISSAADLRFLSDAVRGGEIFKGKYIKLTTDITINSNLVDSNGNLNGDGSNFEQWIPIGRYDPSFFFCGTFDGDNHVIKGIYYDRPQGEDGGLFGKLFGTVKNLIVTDSFIRGNQRVGGIVGSTRPNYIGSTISSSIKEYYQNSNVVIKIANCVSGDIGLFNQANSGKIIAENGSSVGGIVGYAYNTDQLVEIKECASNIKVVGRSDVGGIVGWSNAEIKSCCNFYSIQGEYNVGGIAGRGAYAVNSANYGSVNGEDTRIGGIFGTYQYLSNYSNNDEKIYNCLSVGEIACSNSQGHIGAITGYIRSQVVSYNHYLSSGIAGYGYKENGTYSNNKSWSSDELKSEVVLNQLNNRSGTNSDWIFGKDGYPTLEWLYK